MARTFYLFDKTCLVHIVAIVLAHIDKVHHSIGDTLGVSHCSYIIQVFHKNTYFTRDGQTRGLLFSFSFGSSGFFGGIRLIRSKVNRNLYPFLITGLSRSRIPYRQVSNFMVSMKLFSKGLLIYLQLV